MKLVAINEDFICHHCNKKVGKVKSGGYRNHCLYCLYGLHLDKSLPGDRNSDCKGVMEPIGLEINSKKGKMIIFRCLKCGVVRKNKVMKDDDYDAILKLSVGGIKNKDLS